MADLTIPINLPTDLVRGPASAQNLYVAVFNGTTGKLIKEGFAYLDVQSRLHVEGLTSTSYIESIVTGSIDAVFAQSENGEAFHGVSTNGKTMVLIATGADEVAWFMAQGTGKGIKVSMLGSPNDVAEFAGSTGTLVVGPDGSLSWDTNPAKAATRTALGLGSAAVEDASAFDAAGSAAAAEAAAIAHADGLVVGLFDDRGNYDASSNLFPSTGGSGTAGAILKGDVWRISVAGTLGGEAVDVGDSIRAIVDTPGQTAENWAKFEANVQQATESTRGTAAIATSAEVNDSYSGNTSDIVTPRWLWGALTSVLPGVIALPASAIASGTINNARLDALLAAIGNLTTAANKMLRFTGTDTVDQVDLKLGVQASYLGTPNWTGTDPGGAVSSTQYYTQVGNVVTWKIVLFYASAGSGITGVTVPLPVDFPTPAIPTGMTGANAYIAPCHAGRFMTSPTAGLAINTNCHLRRNTADDGFEITAAIASGAYRIAIFGGSYHTA